MGIEKRLIEALLEEIKKLKKENLELTIENSKLKRELKNHKTPSEAELRAEWGIYG